MKKILKEFRKRVLQILFIPSLLWGIFMFFHEEIDALFSLIPGKEEGWLHNVAEYTLEPVLFSIFISVIIYLFYRFPSFLIVPISIPFSRVIIHLFVYTVLIAVVLAVVIALAWWLFVESGQNPNNVQYGMATLSMGFFGSAFLTPVCTIVTAWFSIKGKSD